MATTTVITITSGDSANQMKDNIRYTAPGKHGAANGLIDYFGALAGGLKSAAVDVQVAGGDSVAASGTIIFSGAATANDTVLINGVTFTAVASGATGNQWNIGLTATATAANLATAITNSVTALVNKQVSASAATGTLTITAKDKGHTGNAITLAKGVDAGPVMTVSGARLTGGTDATAHSFSFGY